VSSGGTDLGAQVSGGTQFDYGFASGVTVFTGSQVVESGGTASGSIVSGGTETTLARRTSWAASPIDVSNCLCG
jgi:autotransporter passenger strand-loop-strand repeat protein